MANPTGINQYTRSGGTSKGFGIKNPKKPEAYFVRNKSASHQFTVMARSSKQARKMGHDLIGTRNKSRLSATPAKRVAGYGKK